MSIVISAAEIAEILEGAPRGHSYSSVLLPLVGSSHLRHLIPQQNGHTVATELGFVNPCAGGALMVIPVLVSCTCCGHEGYDIEFLRCIQCLERFCLAPSDPCIRGCGCTTPTSPISSQPARPVYFQQEARQSMFPSDLT